eukprot:CAMPEP_0182418950 /NCGR_PEP_ID=MMETSP1167-20130531/3333_1 /TAXON_ID=2988 /ORGANISM="Mallomonas Sp, Strain CCMP3275" /LENGTH=85 /DNA_ID=CAMNT_0024593457 /DNA_START=56 /DNA_END=313 /DNA_ORIENTATION=-
MEQFGSTRFINAIHSAFLGQHHLNITEFGVVNSGLVTSMGMKCTDLIPTEVLQRMKEENAMDIELYEYAVKIFEERAKIEGWDKE